MIDLSDITLCAVSNANIAMTMRAIEICQEQCNVGETVFFTSADVFASYRIEKIENFQRGHDAASFIFNKLPDYIKTKYVLLVQWDGYIINPEQWTDEFLGYDYIGAKWGYQDGYNIGNSGFCLRSMKLLNALSELNLPENIPEDTYICRMIRPMLEEKYGIRFAPDHIADRFSYERGGAQRSFGFHGLFNMFRHVGFEEMKLLINDFDNYVIHSVHYQQLMDAYKAIGKLDIFDLLEKKRTSSPFSPMYQS